MTSVEERLGRSGALFLLGCAVLAAVCLVVGIRYFADVSPEASIQFDVDRDSSREVALGFLEDLGADVSEYRHASRFRYADEAKMFLERTLGLEAANPILSDDLRLWRWTHRWFRPLQKEEFVVAVATGGGVVGLAHLLDEDAPGDSLDEAAARRIAEEFLRNAMGLSLGDLSYLEAGSTRRPHRVDHTLTWERAGWDVSGGRLRHEVTVSGSLVTGYRLYLNIPEDWTRSYEKLRSLNDGSATVASSLYVATILLIVGVLVARIRRRDIRWKPAMLLGLVGGLFTLLAQLNGFPNSLFDYDTREALEAFVVLRIGMMLLAALGVAAGIFLLTAGAEPLYRERYPGKFALGGWFSRGVLRTRRFLISSVLGLTLTCFFFAYQVLFYKIAEGFGAWSPAEVPYNNLLNTAIPWAFLLLSGFLPAVSEEFIARMFSIPFLHRFLRSRALAVLLPAFIWGFAHSNYPNQPFYIRGLEVGLAGILIGVVMLRFNILTALIWHYTVDAVYTGLLLLRSGNPYYVTSAAIVGGLFLLPVVYAAVSYAVTRRFADPRPFRNDAIGTAPPLPDRPPAALEPAAPAPVSPRRRGTALAILAAGLVLVAVPTGSFRDAETAQIGKERAPENLGWVEDLLAVDLDTFRVAVTLEDPLGRHDRTYLVRHLGQEGTSDFLREHLTPVAWRVRAFQEFREEEMVIGVDPRDGEVFFFRHEVAESAPGASPSRDEAEEAARSYLEMRGVDLSLYELAEIEAESRPARVDHTVIHQSLPDVFPELGEARLRKIVGLQGDRITSERTELKLPESWVREREASTLVRALRIGLLVAVASCAVAALIWIVLGGHRSGRLRWRPAFLAGGVVAVLSLLSSANVSSALLARYPTSVPWNVFLLTSATSLVLAAVVLGILGLVGMAMLQSAFPRFWNATHPVSRRNLRVEAFHAALALVGLGLVMERLTAWAGVAFPSLSNPSGASLPSGASGLFPLPTALFGAVQTSVLAFLALALIGWALQVHPRRAWWRPAGAAALAVALVPVSAGTAGEFGLGLARATVLLLGLIWLVRTFFRDNPWAYVLGAVAWGGVDIAAGLLRSGVTAWRLQGVVLLLLVALPVMLYLTRVGTRRDPA